ncbi:MAG: hypothetical protein MZV63_72210 [Marinilabiliales bacterium]|nr:hypothetical protein [Marinilabiliales bacterium]
MAYFMFIRPMKSLISCSLKISESKTGAARVARLQCFKNKLNFCCLRFRQGEDILVFGRVNECPERIPHQAWDATIYGGQCKSFAPGSILPLATSTTQPHTRAYADAMRETKDTPRFPGNRQDDGFSVPTSIKTFISSKEISCFASSDCNTAAGAGGWVRA